MSGIVQTILFRCERCELQVPLEQTRRFSRRLASGEEIPFLARWGHCEDCRSLVELEELPSEADVNAMREMAELAEGDGAAVEVFSIAEVDAITRWRAARVCAPRCTSCSGFDVVPCEYDRDGFHWTTHRVCGGRLVTCGIHYREGEPVTQVFDAEGLPWRASSDAT